MKRSLVFFLFVCIKLINAQTINVVAGNGNCCGAVDGIPATTSAVYYPNGVAVDQSGNIYISEPNKIRKVDPSGIINTSAGSLGGYSGDGGPATSALLESHAVIVDQMGNIYSADWSNCVIRKINTAGIISTIAGTGTNGYSGDGGLAINAQLNGPYGLALDATGNLYIADMNNHRIRKINSAGIITTIAGNGTGGYSGDGGLATAAKLYSPWGITIDAGGNLYIADSQNNRIRKVSTSGIITTIAGVGTNGFSGDGGLATGAELKEPSGVAFDSFGNLFIADFGNTRIRMINSTGIINTIAGSTYGYAGDGGPAISAQFSGLWGITTDSADNLYIADGNNHRIRKISNITGISNNTKINNLLSIYPNPNNGIFYIDPNSLKKQTIQIFDSTGKLVFDQIIINKTLIDISYLNEGVYSITIKSDTTITNKKLVIVK